MHTLSRTRATKRPRTYFVSGHRVEQKRHAFGPSSWACDCAEYRRAKADGIEPTCVHSQRVAAAFSVDRLLGARGLVMPTTGC